MAKRRSNKVCDVCGVLFPPRQSANTCGEDCAKIWRKQRIHAHYVANKPRIAAYHKEWNQENAEEIAAKSKARRERNLERYNAAARERKRQQRGTDPSKFIENRDPEAIKARKRERWRRGQANRRARKAREAGHGPTENLQ
ncbi:MAG TPA: hypothetical protein VGO52_20000 [Hyphomonadaceae bacterium]|jgi:hypothetical protein|nr:hypothetical protein [Hyphomonadaceae bacterium]